MHKPITLFTTLCLVTTLALPVAAQEPPTADTVVATVNGTPITLGHMIAARATLSPEYDNISDQELYNGILQQLVQQSALSQKFKGDLPKNIRLTLENEERSIRAAQMIEAAIADAITEDDIQAQYQQQFGAIEAQKEFNAAHILVKTQSEADAIKTQLDNGADFATLAKEKSIGPSGPQGGELGWFSPGMMVPSFEQTTIALKVGEVSAPVETQFGWHVILLNDTRAQAIPTLEEKRDTIESDLKQNAAIEIISGAADNADVKITEGLEIDPATLRKTELLE